MSSALTQIYSQLWETHGICECNMSGRVKISWYDRKSELLLLFQLSENNTFDNMHHFTIVCVTLRPLLYYFLLGTEAHFKVSFAGDSHYLDGRVIYVLKIT